MTVAFKNKKPILVSPAALRQAGFKSGQELEVRVSSGAITILPKLPITDEEYTAEQRRTIDAQLSEGLADINAGRVRGPFATHTEFIASLHNEAKKLSRKRVKRSV